MRIKSILPSLTAAMAMLALSAGAAHAATNLVVNGNFDATTNGTNKQLAATPAAALAADKRTTLTGWTSSNGRDGGYNFVLDADLAKTWDSAIWLRSENKGVSNGYTSSANGGNIFASDALYHPGTLSQTISGLTQDAYYTLTFDFALAQQVGFTGANTDNYWHVVFGDETFNSNELSIASGGFSGWETATMTFKASSTSQVLSFLAQSSAPGAPPFLLLDSVALAAAVPEPSTWGMMLGGIGLVGLLARRRARQA
ncbi:MAG: PEPxxWA-CTERM sorting domain-containing protein [Duganella sp.]